MENWRENLVPNITVLPYEVLDVSDWSFEHLTSYHRFSEENKGIVLSDLVEFNPVKLDRNSVDAEKQYIYIDISSVSSEDGMILEPKYVLGSELPARATLKVRTGDVIVSSVRPERNTVAIIDKKFDGSIVSNSFVVLRPKKISSELLYFVLRSENVTERMSRLARGTIPTVKLKDFRELVLPSIEINEKNNDRAVNLYCDWVRTYRAAKTLAHIVEDCFIRHHLVNPSSNLNEDTLLYKALPYEQLGDRLDVGFYFTSNQKETQWLVVTQRLKNVVKNFRSGAAIPSKEYGEEGIPYVRIKDMDNNKITLQDAVFVSEEVAQQYPKSRLTAGNVLISRVGTIGKSALVTKEIEGAIVNQHITIVELNEEILLPEFFVLYLNTSWATEQFNQRASGSAQQFIKLGDIKELIVPVPNLQKQQEIVNDIMEKISENRLDSLRKEIAEFTEELMQ
jgi:type I restriction enzyme, S subunit